MGIRDRREPSKDTVFVSIKLPAKIAQALDRIAAGENYRNPAARATRSSLIRAAIINQYKAKV